jgi:hypothetical protein
MSDQEIISQLRTGQQHKALVKLYAHLPKVERMVRNHGGTRADAKDLFQDALIILLGKAKDEGIHAQLLHRHLPVRHLPQPLAGGTTQKGPIHAGAGGLARGAQRPGCGAR